MEDPEQALNGDLISTMGVWDCIIAVGILIGTVGFPLSKIAKWNKANKYLGGVTKTIKKIYNRYKQLKSWNWRTTDAWKKAVTDTSKGLPKATLGAFLDFFNIANIIKSCT